MILGEFQKRREALKHVLVEQAGKDPLEDRYHVGYIAAVNDLLNVDVDEVQVD